MSCENLPENAEMYGAVYDGEGVLLAASKINDYTAEFDASDIELAQSVKIFAWDGADTMRPLCAAYEGDIVLRDNKVYYSKRAVIDQAGNVYAAIGDVMYILSLIHICSIPFFGRIYRNGKLFMKNRRYYL